MKRAYVWDISTRLFHWLLVILIAISMYTGFVGGFEEMDWHMYSGYGILALIVFRITWGIFGSRNARFATFLTGPGSVIAYLRRLMTSGPSVGHSPLGGLAVMAILLAVLVQAVTGLFANDDIFIEGPLVDLVSEDTSNWLTDVHEINRWIIIGLIALHVSAIAFYEFVKRDRLLMPMITGYKHDVDAEPEQNRLLVAIVLFGVSAGGVYYLVEIF